MNKTKKTNRQQPRANKFSTGKTERKRRALAPVAVSSSSSSSSSPATSTSSRWHHLQAVLLTEIVSYVDVKDVCNALSVCRAWHDTEYKFDKVWERLAQRQSPLFFAKAVQNMSLQHERPSKKEKTKSVESKSSKSKSQSQSNWKGWLRICCQKQMAFLSGKSRREVRIKAHLLTANDGMIVCDESLGDASAIAVYTLSTQKLKRRLEERLVGFSSFQVNSRWLVASDLVREVTNLFVWDLDSGRLADKLENRTDINDVEIGGDFAAVVCDDRLNVWNLETRQLLKTVDIAADHTVYAKVQASGFVFQCERQCRDVSGYLGQKGTLWNMRNSDKVEIDEPINHFMFSASGNELMLSRRRQDVDRGWVTDIRIVDFKLKDVQEFFWTKADIVPVYLDHRVVLYNSGSNSDFRSEENVLKVWDRRSGVHRRISPGSGSGSRSANWLVQRCGDTVICYDFSAKPDP